MTETTIVLVAMLVAAAMAAALCTVGYAPAIYDILRRRTEATQRVAEGCLRR
ncbi:MAG TPA: hypothetical protein PLT68_11980 [Actinomycetota bacterium]|nr:hypothetical protein [Actinomycetota bacterium]